MSQHLNRAVAFSAAVAVILAACSPSDPVGPGTNNIASSLLFSRTISLPDVQQKIDSGPTRVRIVLADTGLLALRLQVLQPSKNGRPEGVEGPVKDITSSGTGGTVTLSIGSGLAISFDGSTKFTSNGDVDGDDHDRDHDHRPAMTESTFVARVKEALAAGRHVSIEAHRAVPATPQAPGDATFLASHLHMDDGHEHARIEMMVAAANFQTNSSPPPDAWITVLGLKIAIDVKDGITKLEGHTEHTEGELDFRGTVKSVDVTGNTVTLADGTVLKIVAGTEIETSGDEDDDHDAHTLASLAAVKAAVDSGKTVIARGEGVLETATPRTIDVIEVRFAIMTPEPEETFFMGMVKSADSVAMTVTLADSAGTVLHFGTGSEIESESGSPGSVGGVQAALAAGKKVQAAGEGTLETGTPRTIEVAEARFRVMP
jgi:hypothetical protein